MPVAVMYQNCSAVGHGFSAASDSASSSSSDTGAGGAVGGGTGGAGGETSSSPAAGVSCAAQGTSRAASPGFDVLYSVDDKSQIILTSNISATDGSLSNVSTTWMPVANSELTALAVMPSGKFAYATDLSNNLVVGFSIDANSGALSVIAQSPRQTPSFPVAAAVEVSSRFLYVLSQGLPMGTGSISIYKIDSSTGTLQEINGSPFSVATQPDALAIDPSGSYLYVANHASGTVSGYVINSVSGMLTEVSGSPFQASGKPSSLSIDPTGRFLYVSNMASSGVGSGSISSFKINCANGALSSINGSSAATGGGAYFTSTAIDPSGKYLYVTNYNEIVLSPGGNSYRGSVSGFQIDSHSGALSELQGSRFVVENNPYTIAIDATGRFAYVGTYTMNSSTSNPISVVNAFSLNATSGMITPLSGSPYNRGGSYPTVVAARIPHL